MPWRAIAEMLGIEADPTVDDGSCLTVLERQQQAQARLKLHQQQSTSAAMTTGNANTQDHIFPSLLLTAFQPSGNGQCRRRQDNYSGNLLGVELSCNNGWDDLVQYPMMGGGDVESSCNNGPTAAGIPSTFSCPRIVAIDEAKDIAHVVKKRKILSTHDPLAIHGVAAKEANGNKMIKGDPDGPTPQPKEEEEEEILQPNCTTTTNNNNKDKKNSNTTKNKEETSADSSKDTSKVSGEVQKPDYIHVRARRGQATDSHSLAERVRREKISERMKYLQDLVPGCNRITGKAGMLDEIINYVQCLQRQVEFLSMKLAAVNPTLTFNPDGLLTSEENFPACGGGIPVAISSELIDPACFSFNVMQQPAAANCGLHMSMNTQPEPALRRAVSVPSPVPDAFDDTFFDVLGASSAWDSDLQGLHNGGFHHGKASFQEILGANNLKMEMM